MRRMVERIISQYGTDMTLTSGTETKTVRAFFRAVGAQVQEGDTLTLGDKTYLFRRAELYYYRNQPVYQWGLCVEKGVNDTWASQS